MMLLAGLWGMANCSCSLRQGSAPEAEIEVSIFVGGYGIDFFLQVARDYEEAHPEMKVNLWGDPRNDEKLRPRFIAGNPPDVVNANFPLWVLVAEKQVYLLDEELEEPAYDNPRLPWRETFHPGALAPYSEGSHTYAVPIDAMTTGVWYNVKMFREHGWKVPRTWGEFLRLCEVIGRTPNPSEPGQTIDPIAFQGAYASYIMQVWESHILSLGGPQAWADCMNLEPGAWSRPEVVEAFRLTQELRQRDYIRKPYLGMSHLESQREFVLGNAAFVFCGTWLKNEMASSTPPGFEMAFFPIPPVEGGKGDPTAMPFGGGCWFVPARAKHPQAGADFLRWLTQRKYADQFARQINALMAVQGADTGLPRELQGAVDALKRAHYTFPIHIITQWYPRFDEFASDACNKLMSLKATPEEICARLERAAEQVRQDKTIIRHHLDPPGPQG